MAFVSVRVCSAITGEELLPKRELQCGDLLQEISAALNSRPYRAVQLFRNGAPVGKGLHAAPGEDVELTAVLLDRLTAEDRDSYLARLWDFRCFPEAARDDPQIVLAALRRHPGVFKFVSQAAKADKEVALVAVQWNGGHLEFVSKSLQDDKDVVRVAVRNSAYSLQYASASLKHDRDIVWEATRCKPASLRYAGRGLVLELVKEDCGILQHAGKEFQRDREIVLAAANQNPSCLPFADERIAEEVRHELALDEL